MKSLQVTGVVDTQIEVQVIGVLEVEEVETLIVGVKEVMMMVIGLGVGNQEEARERRVAVGWAEDRADHSQ
jgi:hypothetical protein